MNPFKLSLQEIRLKGIALLLLLWHRLFYSGASAYTEYYVAGVAVINNTGIMAKVCVALFVLLSGYGLTIQAQKSQLRYTDFMKKRLKKLMINFGMMWLLFVPIGLALGGISLQEVYGDYVWLKLIINMLFGFAGVNPTWWFYSLIIVLYALFPLLLKCMCTLKRSIILGIVSAVLVVLPHFTCTFALQLYLVSFVFGIFMAKYYNKLKNKVLVTLFYCVKIYLLIIILLLTLYFRCLVTFNISIGIDCILSLLIVMLYKYTFSNNSNFFTRFLELCGKHSFNIFLFHTFIYYLYFPDVLYYPRNPILIFLWLLAICLLISIGIEKIKRITGLDRI